MYIIVILYNATRSAYHCPRTMHGCQHTASAAELHTTTHQRIVVTTDTLLFTTRSQHLIEQIE